MTAPNASDYELLTEHFGYPPVALLDDIINTVNVLADRALDSVERLLLSIPPQNLGFTTGPATPPKSKSKRAAAVADAPPQLPPEEAAKFEIENGTHQLETLLNASIDKNFDLFELYVMQNVLTVQPRDQPFVRLAHYDGLDFSTTGQPDRPTEDSVSALRRRLQASQRLHLALETERSRNDALLRKLKNALGVAHTAPIKREDDVEESQSTSLAFLQDKRGLEGSGADKPITTTTEFTLSQLQSLRSLSSSLRDLLPSLGPSASSQDAAGGSADDAGDSKSWRRQRAEYIEGSSRKYLERSAGLELCPDGEVRDGDWQGVGRSISKDDVEGLEKVVAILGQGKEGSKTPAGPSGDAGDAGGNDTMDES